MGTGLIVRGDVAPIEGDSKLIERTENTGESFMLVFKAESHVVNFQVFKIYISAHFVNGNLEERERELELYASGGLKWDGCCNMQWHTEKHMAHFCGLDDAIKDLTSIMTSIYELGPLMESWDR